MDRNGQLFAPADLPPKKEPDLTAIQCAIYTQFGVQRRNKRISVV
jgi:hypothetical protein